MNPTPMLFIGLAIFRYNSKLQVDFSNDIEYINL